MSIVYNVGGILLSIGQTLHRTLDGTAKDVSFLIDHLPYYLYPSEERKIVGWGVAGNHGYIKGRGVDTDFDCNPQGISLGGHSAWICLAQGIVSVRYYDPC